MGRHRDRDDAVTTAGQGARVQRIDRLDATASTFRRQYPGDGRAAVPG